MDIFFFKPQEYNRLYNCSQYSIDDVPIEKRTHRILGWLFIVLFTVIEALYIPCVISISKGLRHASFKFMFYIGIGDLIALWISGFFTGYFALTGAVFCSHPTLIYFLGSIGMALWYVESFAAMLLAFNRCVEVWSPNWAHRLFRDNLTWLWLSIVTLYAFVGIVFTTPSVFTSIHVSWFYNPHVGYIDDFAAVYNNKMHSAHNIIIALGLFSLYVVFCVTLVFKRRYYQERAAISRQSKMPFIQVFLITTVNMVASSIYVYMNFFAIGETLIIIGSLMWFFAHGIPAVIYLTMNNTIRKDYHKYVLILTKIKGLRGGAIMPKIPSVSGMLTSTRQNMVNAE